MKETALSATWGPRHRSSVDTNVSGIADSTISIGQISKFPEPPSSIPNSPATPTFAAAAAVRQLPIPPRNPRLQAPYPPKSATSFVNPSHSFVQPSSNAQKASTIVSAHDWHDGASSIEPNTTNKHLLPNTLPTSFITALLQENKFKRVSSTTSLALSGISETLSPRNPPGPYGGQYNISSSPAFPVALMPGYDSENSARTVATATGWPTSETSKSFGSTKTFNSSEGLLEKRLSTTPESGCVNPKQLDSSSAHQPHFLSKDPTPSKHYTGSRLQHGSPVSIRSSKSFVSRMSHRLSLFHVFVRKTKPLPPVPVLPSISLAQQKSQQEFEMSSPLPDLINRATTLRRMLENGQRPYSNAGSFEVVSPRDTHRSISGAQEFNGKGDKEMSNSSSSWYQKFQHAYASTRDSKIKRKRMINAGLLILIILLVVGLVLGLVFGLRKPPQTSCSGGKVGDKCNINANCICTSTTQCNGLAQVVIDLLPSVNSIFKANYTAALAYSSFWLMEGGSQGNNCAAQAVILDVGNNLINFPDHAQWAQTALLWNALQTQDLVAALQLQKFVQSLPWNSLKLKGPDRPVNNGELASFSITVSGYTFNFASQTITQPPGTFLTLVHPSDGQIQQVSPTALTALDRMYTYAQASSSQQQVALQKYWTSVLLQRADTLPIFKAALSVSPLMLPFNASSRVIRDLYPSTSSPFPPPLSCFTNLDPPFQRQLSMFETAIFGLPNISSNQTGFNASCYRDRPIYGVLDLLQMRLPFGDNIPSVTQHAAVLTRDSSSRVVFSVGKGFSGIFNGTVNLAPSQLDPRQYGTVNFLDHVILQYLTSIGDINVANALVKFVLDSSTAVRPVPPYPSSALHEALKTLRTIEVAVFGDITPSDFSSIVSPFTINSGALFFGSDDGAALRNWTIGTTHLPIVWTQNATSSLVVRDNSLGENPVTRTWNSISLALSRRMTNIGLVNITSGLGTQSFSP